MIIWGWKTVFRVIGSGVFSCPSCGADRNYERRKAQRFFTLFFIPLIPLKTIGEFVRCTYCKNDFRESVLSRPTAAQFTDLLQNTVRGVMVSILRRGGWEHPAARASAVHEIATAGVIGYAEANLAQDMQVVPDDLTQLLAALAGQLPETGREALVTGATRVAVADGPVQPAERAVIDTIGAALGMSQMHVAGIVAGIGGAAPAAAVAGAPAGGAGKETMLIQAPQPAPATGAQDAVPASGTSGNETLLIQAPQPTPAADAQDAAPAPAADNVGNETLVIQAPQPIPAADAAPAPAADNAGNETLVIQAPQPAPAPATDAVPASAAGKSGMETMLLQAPQPPQEPQPPVSSMETMVLATPPVPAESAPAPAAPQTMVDTSASMETVAVPVLSPDQIPQPRSAESAQEQ